MGRNPKVSKEIKIIACETYKNRLGSFNSIAQSLGVATSTVREWYYRYLENGEKAFTKTDKNKSYSREFKQGVIKDYLEAFSLIDIASKYNISRSMVLSWVNKYNNGIELKDYNPKPEVYTMGRTKVSAKEKLKVVKHVIDNNMNYTSAASKFSIKYSSVYLWTRKYLSGGEESLNSKKRGPRKKKISLGKMSEVERFKYLYEQEKIKREKAEFRVEALKKKQEIENKLYRK